MAMWVLLLLMATPVSASLATWSMDCGTDHLSYFTSPHISFFFINSKAVDHVGFCNKFVFCYNHGCLCNSDFHEWAKVGEHFCNLKLTQVGLQCRAGRKLLLQLTNEPKSSEAREEKKLNASSMGSKTTLVALPGLFLLCCALVCPCFRTRSKQTEHTALAKDPSSNSVSSFGVSSTSERMPGSPLRVPPSPLRVPPSPLRVPPSPSRFSASPQLNRVGSIHLNMNQVNKATRNFSPSLKIGEGGFGTVYRAQLQDGQVVAVKRANKEHFDALHVEFSSEVDLLAKIEHRNLVKLLGYVKKGNERLIITEYVPNGTLREHLDGQHGKVLDFNQRLEIAIDVTHALTYLHLYTEKSIIHRDVKSSNILLTESLRAKVADFGFARLGPSDVEQTHISTKVKGTVGYLDPEYLKTYQLTPKSDVYSFGILLIEIFSARRPVDLKKPTEERVTVRWAFKNYNEGKLGDIMDPLMEEEVDMGILSKLFSLAFQCAAPTRSDRPSMKEVGEQLWGIRSEYYRTVRRP